MQCYERKKKVVTEGQWQGFQISCYPIRTNLLESSPVLKLEMGSWPFTETTPPCVRRLERNNAWGHAKEEITKTNLHTSRKAKLLSAQIRGLQQTNTQIGPKLENLLVKS